jgi:hypothetical protein
MSRNGSGTFTLVAGNPVVTGTTITSSWANTTMQNIADGLTQSVASDGQTPMSGALNMATNKINNLGTPAVSTDAATKAYVDLTQTASGITGGTINGTTVGATTASTGSFTSLAYSTTLTGGTGIVNLGSGQFYKDASGNVGIGTSSPSYKLQVAPEGSGGDQLAVFNDTTNAWTANGGTVLADFYAQTTLISGIKMSSGSPTSGYLTFHTGGNTERMRIDGSGNLLVGTTSLNGRMTLAYSAGNGVSIQNNSGSSSNGIIFLYGGSSVGSVSINSGSTSFNTSSDYRLKENIAPMTGALDKVSALKPVTYTWKADGSDSQGFIAHELAEIVPECVTGEKDAVDADGKPVYQGIDTSFLVATLTAAIQEQQEMIENLTARLSALEEK